MKKLFFLGLLMFQLVQGYADPVYSAYPAKILTDKDYEITFQNHQVELQKQQKTLELRDHNTFIIVSVLLFLFILFLFSVFIMEDGITKVQRYLLSKRFRNF